MPRHELPYPAAPGPSRPDSAAPYPVHPLPYPAAPGRSRPDSAAPSPVHPRQGGTLAQRIAANREGIEALKVGTARLRARVEPLRERTVAHLSPGTPRLAARVARDSRPREWS